MTKRKCGTSPRRYSERPKREWEPLPQKRVKAIRDDTEQDCPVGDYTAAEIYEIASEVLLVRFLIAELDAEMDGVSVPESAAAILNRFRSLMGGEGG